MQFLPWLVSSFGFLAMLIQWFFSDIIVMFWAFDPAKNAIQGDAPEGGDTF